MKKAALLALPLLLLLGSCDQGIDLTPVIKGASFNELGEEIADEDGNSITVNSIYSQDDGYFVAAVSMKVQKYYMFSYQVLPISRSNFDVEKTNLMNKSHFYYGQLNATADVELYFVGASSFEDSTYYYIDFGIVEEGYPKSFFIFQGSEVEKRESPKVSSSSSL